MKYLLTLALLLPSCNIRPTKRLADGSIITLGASLGTKSDNETASYTNGPETLAWSSTKHDETVIPVKYLNIEGTKAALSATTSALRTTESTKRVLSGHEVQKTGIKSAASVEKLRIVGPVAEAAP